MELLEEQTQVAVAEGVVILLAQAAPVSSS
jgi:hypothetical protein